MKKNTFLWEVTGRVISGATICLLVAGSSIFQGCQKTSIATPKQQEGVRQSGFVLDPTQPDGTGNNNGFFWSLYQEGGSANITFGNAGNFAISYSNVNDVVGGKGWNPGSARTIGYNVGALSGSYNFVGIYGWTTSPLIEYYVGEFGNVSGGTFINTVNSDGHNYNVYKQQRVNAPSIIGTATFWQYKDQWGGSSTGSNRSVNMGNHINNWRSRGGQGFGSFNYQILALEAWGNRSGYINATCW